MKPLELLFFWMYKDMHKVMVVKNRAGLFNEYVK